MPYSPMPLEVAQVGNLENITCDLNEVTRLIHQNKTSSEQQPQQKLAVLKLQFQSQNLSRTTSSTQLVGVDAIRSNIPCYTICNRPTQKQTHFSEKENRVSLINTPPKEHI